MLKEILIFISLFILLSLGIHHKEWIEYPIEHLTSLYASGAYGFGFMHPFIFTLILYTFIYIIRGIIKVFSKLYK